MADAPLLIPGQTCWRVAHAERYARIIDAADYFRHAKAAMLQASRRILLIGWDFDTRMTFERGGKTLAGPNQLGLFLRWLVRVRPDLEIYLLKSNLRLLPAFEGLWRGVTPVGVLNWLSGERLQFAIDGVTPTGAVHHQKIAVIDDAVAFCGGIDFTLGRWDTPEHLHRNNLRRSLNRSYGPRHEVAAAVDGAAARALGAQACERWQRATGRPLEPIDVPGDRWPDGLDPTIRDVGVGIVRTLPAPGGGSDVREVEALNLAAIAAARHTIYLENQYLASRKLAQALAERLQDPDGPEVVIVLPRISESRLEQQSMDSARHRLLQMLWAADTYGRLGVYWPATDRGAPIYVHAKVLVVDDRLLRIGSSNLNNRSLGFDSECDLAVEAGLGAGDSQDGLRRTIVSVRDELVCEHLGVTVDDFGDRQRRTSSFLQAIESLAGRGRTLRRFTERTVAGEGSLLAENDLMDPDRVPRSLVQSVQRFITGLNR